MTNELTLSKFKINTFVECPRNLNMDTLIK